MEGNNSIPDGWERRRIGEYAVVKRGASPRPIQDPKWWGGEIGWVRISDVTASRKYLTRTRDYLSAVGVRNSIHITPGDVILSICATIGRPVITAAHVCIHDGFVWFDGLSDRIDREYFYYFLASQEEALSNQRQTGTQGNLNTGIVSNVALLMPKCKTEQSKIAEILSTVDRAIEQTEALIAKQQRIKTGLMQDLLTRGIDEQGNLRSEETHQFKDSPLGRIPVEWDAVPLRKLVYIKHGYAFAGEHFTDQRNDNVLLTPGNFHVEGGLYFTKGNTKYYNGAVPEDFVLSNGDVLVVMTDLTKEMAILARTVVLNHPSKVLHNQRIGKVIANKGVKLDAHFLALLMNSDTHRDAIKSTATGTTVRHTSPDKLLTPFVPEIEHDEQVRIRGRIAAVDSLLQRTSEELAKTVSLKTALMQDLLTGEKRVTPLLEPAVTT